MRNINVFNLGLVSNALHAMTVGAALFAGAAAGAQPTTYTSPIDITGMRVLVVASAPDRNTGKPVEVPLPLGLLGPKMNQFVSTPLSTQVDRYWSVTPDPKTGKTPRDQACNGPEGIIKQVQDGVHKIGSSFNAYDISCNLVTTGSLLLKQTGSWLYIGYELRNNKVDFRVTTPGTCKPGHGTPVCPNDPHFVVTFATELTTLIRAPDVCHIVAESGTVTTSAVSIDGANLAGDLAKLGDDLFLGHKFRGAERAIEAVEKQVPLPLDSNFQELRNSDACTGKNSSIRRMLAGFRDFDVTVQPSRGILFRMSHVALTAPTVSAPDANASRAPSQPTFTRPMISTNRPVAAPGSSLQVSGQYFPPNLNLSTALPVTLGHGGYGPGSIILGGVCFGGATELQWGLIGAAPRQERLAGDAQGACASRFDAANLSPGSTYQFRARDCDAVTCSPWSAQTRAMTARANADSGAVTLTMDGASGPTLADKTRRPQAPAGGGASAPGISAARKVTAASNVASAMAAANSSLGSATVSAQGTFVTTVTIPAGASPGAHTIRAVNGSAVAEVGVTVSGPNAGAGAASLMIVGLLHGETGCPNHPIASTATGSPFMLFGAGMDAGPVAVHLDAATGPILGNANARPDGTFCQQMPGVPGNQAGNHRLLAVQNGSVKAQTAVTFVAPSIVH